MENKLTCPACGKTVNEKGSVCSHCGYAFPEELRRSFDSYFECLEEDAFLGSIIDSATLRRRPLRLKLQEAEQRCRDLIKKFSRTAEVPVISGEVEGKGTVELSREARTSPMKRLKREGERQLTEEKLGQKWLLVAGIVILLFGVGYFLKYSFEKGWIGPVARVVMAYMLGGLLLGGGRFSKAKGFVPFGLSIMGGGLAVFYFATFAAFSIYGLFGQGTTFAIMVLITALSASLSLLNDAKWLAVLGLAGGFLTPLFLSTGENNQVFLMTYMVFLNGGILGIAFFRRWSLLNVLGFLATWILYSGWHGSFYAKESFALSLFYVSLFFLMYSIVPFAYYLLKRGKDESVKGFYITIPNSFIAFGFSYGIIVSLYDGEWASLVTFLYGVIFGLMALWMYRKGMMGRIVFAVLVAHAALFFVITVPLFFSGPWITIFWGAQALLLLFLGAELKRPSLNTSSLILTGITLGKFLFYDFSEIFGLAEEIFYSGGYSFMMGERLVLEIFLLILLFVSAVVAKRKLLSLLNPSGDKGVYYALFGFLLFVILHIEVLAFFHQYLPDARNGALSVYWALYSAGIMAAGFRFNSSLLRRTAMVIFAVTVLKVFFYDTAEFSTPYRIVSFLIVGILLVGASFLYHRYRDRIIEAVSDENE